MGGWRGIWKILLDRGKEQERTAKRWRDEQKGTKETKRGSGGWNAL